MLVTPCTSYVYDLRIVPTPLLDPLLRRLGWDFPPSFGVPHVRIQCMKTHDVHLGFERCVRLEFMDSQFTVDQVDQTGGYEC